MDIGWKIVSTGTALLAGLAATKVLDLGWKVVTGHEPPKDDGQAGLREAIVFAAVSGAVAAAARHFAMRGATKWYGGPLEPSRD